MDVFLTLRLASVTGDVNVDVRVEVEPDDTIASLADALAAYSDRRGLGAITGGDARLLRSGAGAPLDPSARVADTGLLSGDTVTLEVGPPDAWPPPALEATGAAAGTDGEVGLSLDVTAGPEAGRMVRIAPGDLTVGRASTCTVVIADATLSREHFMVHVTADRQVWLVPNPSATNGTFIGNEEVSEPRLLEPGQVIQAGAGAFVVRAAVAATRRRDLLGQLPFNRVPYHRTVVTQRAFDDLAAPPDKQRPRKLSIATALSPAMSGVAISVMTQRYYFLAIAGLSPVLLAYRHVSEKRGGKRSYIRERDAFRARLETRAAEVDAALEQERAERLQAAPDLAELARQAMAHMPRLWERNRLVDDFLELRLGLGDLESRASASVERRGDDELREEGHQRLVHQAVVHEAPVTVNLVEAGVVGLSGDPREVAAVGGSLAAQAACLHSPEDLVMAAAVHEADVPAFEWLKWLPHVRSSTSPLEGEHLAVGPDATRSLLVNLLAVVADRAERSSTRDSHVWPRVVVLVQEAAEPDRVLLSRLLDGAPQAGIHVVWMGESELQVPRHCRAVVSCPGGGQLGLVRYTEPQRRDRVVTLDGARPSTAMAVARALAPLRDASAGNESTAIPRVVPLLDVIGMGEPGAAEVVRRWRTPRPYGLELPIGMAADGVFRLDLVEQGPHTLIGGTSGAGKSELLQTLVLALAADHSPERLAFLFVDYKGGASSAEFRDLPHTVGYVTNLDGRLSLRALTSLRAELQRRMTLMEGRAKDLAEMLQVAPEDAPPSLVIVVDEFATLVKEIPEFVAGMVDIAQRGRSLGIHLVLATQRPTGAVNENIRVNTNLRISLRVLDPADSTNIVGTRDAADIPVPLRGRAYARTGPHDLVAFQCAWAGAPLASDDGARAIGVRGFGFGAGLRQAPEAPAVAEPGTGRARSSGSDPGTEPPTHLGVLVAACAEAGRALRLPPPRRPWVEPLPEVIGLGSVLERISHGELTADPGRRAVLGLYDDPENQAQHVASVDLEASGGLMVFGTGGSGKTTLLRTIAAGMASQGSADEVQIYGLDFASRALDAIAELPHCAAVVPGDDSERVTRLLTLLAQEIERRRDALASSRAESLGALRARSLDTVFPRIVVLVDSYSGFHSAFDRADSYQWLAELQRIVSGGRQVGVHCVLTTERRLGIPSALLSAVSSRLALRMATSEELTSLGVPTKVAREADLPNGRGYLDGSTEIQVACVSEDPSGMAQAEAIAAVAAKLAVADPPTQAPDLPVLPETVVVDRPSTRPLTAPLGITDLTLATAEVDLARHNLLVTGPPLSGKSGALETVAWGIRATSEPDLHLVALGGAASPLAALDLWDDAAFARAAHAPVVGSLAERLAGDESVDARVVLFVDTAEDLEGNDVLRPLEAISRRDALRIVVACESSTIAKAHSGWLSALRRNRSVLVLQPETRNDVDAIAGVKPALRPGQEFPPGRGVLVAKRHWSLVQVGLRPGTTIPSG